MTYQAVHNHCESHVIASVVQLHMYMYRKSKKAGKTAVFMIFYNTRQYNKTLFQVGYESTTRNTSYEAFDRQIKITKQ